MITRKQIIYIVLLIICCKIILGCANISAPTGGPKDEIPPKPLSYLPRNNSVNFKSKTFYIKFDEKLKDIDDVSQIIINPKLEKEITVKIKNKRTVQVEINETLQDSTTYNFNFRNTIKDLTEGNTTDQIIQYSFSTGNYIDSNTVFGTTIDLFSNKINENIVVGLYKVTDTLDISTDFPLYSSKVNKDGTFTIKNIKTGLYKIITFEDTKNTLLYDNDEKVIDFVPEMLIEGQIEINFKLSKINNGGINVVNGKNISPMIYEINLSKGIKSAAAADKNNFKTALSRNGKTVTVYNLAQIYNDSISVDLNLKDSLNIDSTLNYKVYYSDAKTKAKAIPATISILKPLDSQITDIESNIDFVFKHAIKKILIDSISIFYDSLNYIPAQGIKFNWLNDSTILSLDLDIKIKDSLIVKINKNAFIDITGDTVKANKFKFRKSNTKSTGVISGTVNVAFKHAILELLLDNKTVVDSTSNVKAFKFDRLAPGKYTLRILKDDNQDFKWTQGNLKNSVKAEDIFYYSPEINLKEDWEITDIDFKIVDK